MNEFSPLKSQYESWHLQRAAHEDSKETLRTPWNLFVQRHIGQISGKKILEMACGRGQLSAWLAAQGAGVIAADFSFTALEILKRNGFQGAPLNADAMALPFAGQSFDIAVSCETIEHLVSPWDCLSEFHRVLKKGGRLFLTFPSYLNLYGLYRIYLKVLGRPYNSGTAIQPRENWLFSWKVTRRLRCLGFKIRYTSAAGHYLLLPGRLPQNLLPEDDRLLINRLLQHMGLHYFVIAEK